MPLWSRVFARSPQAPEPGDLLALVNTLAPVSGHFTGDDQGWFRAEFSTGAGSPLQLERYLATEEGIRAELNNWAAFLETCDFNPIHHQLMEHVIQSTQLFNILRPIDHTDDLLVEKLRDALCRHLAANLDGLIQIDGMGFYSADWTLLLQEY